MARVIGIPADASRIGVARVVTGAPVAADSTTLTDANISPTVSATTGGALSYANLETIWLGLETAGGTAPSVVIDPLMRDDDAADGSRWRRFGDPVALSSDGGLVEVRVDGRRMFPRLASVVGNPTTVTILVVAGRVQSGKGSFR